jgi:hypothetical protein
MASMAGGWRFVWRPVETWRESRESRERRIDEDGAAGGLWAVGRLYRVNFKRSYLKIVQDSKMFFM